jgi:hypothetical protein
MRLVCITELLMLKGTSKDVCRTHAHVGQGAAVVSA